MPFESKLMTVKCLISSVQPQNIMFIIRVAFKDGGDEYWTNINWNLVYDVSLGDYYYDDLVHRIENSLLRGPS
jgi:hypothetical protein